MDSYFTDPRELQIRLEDSCWTHHILKRHLIMIELRVELEETVERPDIIFRSKIDPEVDLYYKQYQHPVWGPYYMMVVVDTVRRFVKTAFPVYNLNKGKEKLWPDN